MAASESYFLFIGHADKDAPASKLRAAGIPYRKKILESRPENWDKIIQILESRLVKGAIVVANGSMWEQFLHEKYRARTEKLFAGIARVPHIFLVHEAVVGIGGEPPEETAGEDDDALEPWDWDNYKIEFVQPPDAVVETVLDLLAEAGISITPYQTNAQRSVLASAFLDDNERDLLFRVYIPKGRLYADEAKKLLGLFRDWLSQVGHHSVRQEGYGTSAGEVYEFFGDGTMSRAEISRKFNDFSGFLDMCVQDPEAATRELVEQGIEPIAGAGLVTRYGKEARRLHVDVRHAREMRVVELRHAFESEVLDLNEPSAGQQLASLIESLVPIAGPRGVADAISGGGSFAVPLSAPTTVNISQQFINRVEGSVVQSLQGTMHFGAEAREILDLIRAYGAGHAVRLESAVHEVEDSSARLEDRIVAKQLLKGFLAQVGKHVQKVSAEALATYLEGKFGLAS